MALGKAVVNILANLKPLKRGLLNAKVLVTKMVSSITRTSFNILKAGLRKIISLAKLAAVSILGIGIASAKVASDSVETENLFTQSFGDMADAADKWAKEYSKSLNLFEVDTKKALGTFFLMISGMGIATDKAFEMSKGLTELTGDLASFRNLSIDEAFTKISAGLTGESEPLKRLGIIVNEATIQLLAQKDANILARVSAEKTTVKMERYGNVMFDAGKKTKTATIVLNEQEKVMLRYQAILNKTQKDQGDMARTVNDTSNVFKQLLQQVKRSADTIGKTLLPEVTKIGIAMRDWLVGNQDQIKAWAIAIKDRVMETITVIKELFALAKGGEWEKVFDRLGDIFKNAIAGLGEFIKMVTPKVSALGKAMADGFWAAIEDTPLGKVLGVTGQVIKGVSKATDVLVGEPARIFGERFGPQRGDVAQLREGGRERLDQARRRGEIPNTEIGQGDAILRELQRLNRQVEAQGRDF
jgi:hypothetical protein